MSTTRTYNEMLNEYLPNSLLKEELIKRDYILNRVEKDNNWKGGDIIVPFKGNGASSIKMAGLTADTDIAESKYVRGKISAYKEVWGSMVFNHTDLIQHDGKIPESTFLRVIPDTVEDFMQCFKETTSQAILSGGHFASPTSVAAANLGKVTVDRIERFQIGQKVVLFGDTDATAGYEWVATTMYVIAIDLNTKVVTFSATRGGAAYDFSALSHTTASKFYHDGQVTITDKDAADGYSIYKFNSIKSALLSAANGGDAQLHGQTKTAYPYLQAININGSDITAANIVEKLFDAYVTIRTRGRGMANEVLMSYKNLGAVLKNIEIQKGSFKVAEGSRKASIYGWDVIEIMDISSQTMLKFVGIQEMDDSEIYFMDWRGFTFRSNGMIKKFTDQDGNNYYTVRSTAGYKFISDIFLFGELEIRNPSNCGAVYGINF